MKDIEMDILKRAQQQILQSDYNKILQLEEVKFKKGHELRGRDMQIDKYEVIHIITRIPKNEVHGHSMPNMWLMHLQTHFLKVSLDL